MVIPGALPEILGSLPVIHWSLLVILGSLPVIVGCTVRWKLNEMGHTEKSFFIKKF